MSILTCSPLRTLTAAATVLALLTGCGSPQPVPAADPEPPPAPAPLPEPATVEVTIYLANDRLGDPCGEVFPVTRTVDASDPVNGALEALLAGPTEPERSDGYGGWFDTTTVDALLDVRVGADGTAHVTFTDLRQLIPNASSSCGSAGLLAQLDQTLLGLDGITATRYALADQDAFYAWLQLTDPDAPDADEPTDAAPPRDPDAPAASGPTPTDLDLGWTLVDDYGWPVVPGCCGAPSTGPPSPTGPLPVSGWPPDGFYDADAVRPADDPEVLHLTLHRLLRLEDPPPPWEGEHEVLVPDLTTEVERVVAIDALTVVLIPIHVEGADRQTALLGDAGAFARLLRDGIDPAYRTWVHEPAQAGASLQAIEADLLARSTDPGFPFGQDYRPGLHPEAPLAYRGPHGSSLLADPSWQGAGWPPGLYLWHPVTLEVRDATPVLHLWAGQIAG